jgi:hypothetical protein
MTTRAGLIVALIVLLGLSPAAQDLNKARALLEQALEALKPPPPPPPPVAIIATPEALDQALAGTDAILTLSPALVYPKALTIRRAVTVQSTVPDGRMTRDVPLPRFTGGLTIAGDAVTLIGLEVRHTNPLTDIVVISGAHVTLDRIRVLGDPAKGAKRGIAANGNGDATIRRSYVDDCFATYPGNDSQAILAYDMAPGLLIEDNYLSGGSETVMIGGADPSSEARIPTDIIIRGNVITKNPAWKPLLIGVKNIIELKDAKNVLIENNDLSYSWGGHGQDGYAVMLTVRNQGGKAPYSTIQDVIIRHNRIAHAAAAINVLGRDNLQPSGVMQRVTITDNTVTDLNPTTYTGSARMILINGGPMDLTITDNTFAGVGLTSAVYFAGGPLLERFTFTGNTYPKTRYGVFGTGATVGQAWPKFVTSGTNGPNTEI